MRTPAAAARRPSPLRRRERSPAKKAGESAYPYEHPASRARPSGESAYPYEHPASRARLSSRRTEAEEDDGFDEEEEDLYGLEPSYRERLSTPTLYTERSSAQQPRLDRRSIEPDGIELDDNLDDVDLETFSAYAYAVTRQPAPGRDNAIPSFRDLGPAGRDACSRLAATKGKGRYEGLTQLSPLSSIPESMMSIATSMPRSIPIDFGHHDVPLRGETPPPIPALMSEVIEADEPWSETYSAFYLTPLPDLSTTSYSAIDFLPAPKRRMSHYVNRPIIIPPHTSAIIIAESAKTLPTTASGGTTTGTSTNLATASSSNNPTSTSTTTTTTAATHPPPPK
ncbi:hypothetical protein V493_07810 [Pseudogymnoascus sp. VKM F-4281 (FW-2241)]|nr:hypothetical protein V493_07810 [Pseudogymnoascus sp. VKM F-4281 (FW-2241)]